MTNATAKKANLSPTAKAIFDRYRSDIKGHEAFLSPEMRFAMLTKAMYSLMVTRYAPGICRDQPASEYVEAMGECIDHLER